MPVLKLGSKYKSAVCETQIIVIRTLPEALDLRCGGVPMVDAKEAAPEGPVLQEGFADGTVIGKRYIDAAERIEFLCAKGGKGSLSLGSVKLQVKQAKALPASD